MLAAAPALSAEERPVGIASHQGLGPPAEGLRGFPVDVHDFRVLERDSGPRNYYRVLEEQSGSFLRGVYGPWLKTVTLFAPVPDELRRGVRVIRFRWRALVLPRGANECVDGRGDGAANVYVIWKRGLRWYSVKLDWSAEAPEGRTCNSTRNPFAASDTVIVRSGGPTGVWREQEIDPDALYRAHFEGGRADAEVPELQGIGILTDGDQTRSVSAADYAGFVLYKEEPGSGTRERPAAHVSSAARPGETG
jgi:Protein of unknown function (DUF3047)